MYKGNDVLLSVVIPVYNSGDTIKECVMSVVNEAELNSIAYEIILVDDGSTDNTFEECRGLCEANGNIKLCSQTNSGPSAARNKGIAEARGEFIAFNDSDDRWIEGKLRSQLEYLWLHPEVDLVCSAYGSGNIGKTQRIEFRREVFHNYFSTQTSLCRKCIFESVGFPENQRYSEDMRFIIDAMCNYTCVYLAVNSTESITRKHVFGETGLSSHLWEMERGELSNIFYVRRLKKISFLTFLVSVAWSLAKCMRRYVVSGIKS